MKRKLSHWLARTWFRLTNDSVCSWCGRRVRRAPIRLGLKRLTDSIWLPRITHTVCPGCVDRVLERRQP